MTSPFLSPKLLASPRYLIRGPPVNITSKAASTGQKELSISTTCGSLPTTHSPLERIRQGHPKVRVIPPRSRGIAATVESTLWWRSLTSSGSSIGCLRLSPWRGCCCMDIRYLSESERKQVSLKIKISKHVFFYQPFTKIWHPKVFFLPWVKILKSYFLGWWLRENVHVFVYWLILVPAYICQTSCHLFSDERNPDGSARRQSQIFQSGAAKTFKKFFIKV